MEENIYAATPHPHHTLFPAPAPQIYWGLLLEIALLKRLIRDLEEVIQSELYEIFYVKTKLLN